MPRIDFSRSPRGFEPGTRQQRTAASTAPGQGARGTKHSTICLTAVTWRSVRGSLPRCSSPSTRTCTGRGARPGRCGLTGVTGVTGGRTRGTLPQTSADFRRTSAGAEVQGNDGEGFDSQYIEYNRSTCTCTGNYFPTFPGSHKPVPDGACAPACDCDPGTAEVQKPDPAKKSPIDERVSCEAALPLPRTTAAQETCGSGGKSPGGPLLHPPRPGPSSPGASPGTRPSVSPVPATTGVPPRIDARDYKPLVPPEKEACHAWGGHHGHSSSGNRRGRGDSGPAGVPAGSAGPSTRRQRKVPRSTRWSFRGRLTPAGQNASLPAWAGARCATWTLQPMPTGRM